MWHDLPLYISVKLNPILSNAWKSWQGKCSLESGIFQAGWLPVCPLMNTYILRAYLESSYSCLMP